jgi:hypothetical protein
MHGENDFYIIISEKDISALQKSVMKKVVLGYAPLGGIAIADGMFYQAMQADAHSMQVANRFIYYLEKSTKTTFPTHPPDLT